MLGRRKNIEILSRAIVPFQRFSDQKSSSRSRTLLLLGEEVLPKGISRPSSTE
jgi:hypothetical protein